MCASRYSALTTGAAVPALAAETKTAAPTTAEESKTKAMTLKEIQELVVKNNRLKTTLTLNQEKDHRWSQCH